MTSTHSDYKSPDEIEREVEEARARLQTTLGDIRESLSPGQMLDHAIEYARESGGAEFTRNLGRQVRDNPLPIALIGAGISWLLAADKIGPRRSRSYYADDHDRLSGHRMAAGLYTDPNKHHVHVDGPENPDGMGARMSETATSAYAGASSRARSASDRASGAMHSASDRASGAMHSASDRARGAVHSASDRARGYGEAVSETAESMRERASEYASGARDRMADAGSAAAGYASDAGHRIRETGSSLQSGLVRLIDEQPLVLGAIGLAVGAAIGAALPRSRAENRMFGSTADRVKGQASQMAREGLSEAEMRSRQAFREAKETLDEHGYSTRGAADTLGDVAETVKSAMAGEHKTDDSSDKSQDKSKSTASGTSTSSSATGPNAGTARTGSTTGQPNRPV